MPRGAVFESGPNGPFDHWPHPGDGFEYFYGFIGGENSQWHPVPAMCERGDGVVITIGSWMASVGSPIVGLYSASKAAEQQLTRSWAAEFGPRGVRFNTVAPGITRTPINEGSGDELDRLAAGTPAGQTLNPIDIARAVAWLASDEARHIHGATLAVDGGISSTRLA